MVCGHKHGDFVHGLFGWVCGQCFEVLGDRPKRYSMVAWGNCKNGERQEVVWQADIIKSNEGTTLSVFLSVVARRFMKKGGCDKQDAYQLALDAVKMMDVAFGHPDYTWCRMSGVDLADEEMAYWDCGASN